MAFIQIDFESKTLNHNTTVYVVLPQNTNNTFIENSEIKYKSMYLFHGYFGNHTDWMRFTSIERYANKYNVAVIMPDAANSYYANMVHGPRYFDFISIELPAYLESILPLSRDKNNRFAAGLSMGGYGALKLGFTYPERFNAVASISGPLDVKWILERPHDEDRIRQFKAIFGSDLLVDNTENDLFYLSQKIVRNAHPRLYINCGNEDFLYDSNQKFLNHLITLDIPFSSKFNPGEHTWDYWNDNIKLVLDFFFNI